MSRWIEIAAVRYREVPMKAWVVICIPTDTDIGHWFAYNRVKRKSIRCIDSREANQLVKTLNERAMMLRPN